MNKPRKKATRQSTPFPTVRLRAGLMLVLQRFRNRWDPKDFPELACLLRQFAESLDKQTPGSGKKEK
jgi:hypothetical protein